MASPNLQLLLAFVIYGSISVLFFGGGIIDHLGSIRLGKSSDSVSFIWVFNWWVHCIKNGVSPFFTNDVWFPYRFNLTQQNAMMMGNFILAAPIAFLFGPVVAYNLTEIFASAISAWSAFILCRYLTQSFSASLFAAYFYGYSTYMLAHTLGHPILITVFFIPLLILTCIKSYRQEIKPITFQIFYVLLLVFQFLTSLETFAMVMVFGTILVILVFIMIDTKERKWILLKNLILGNLLTFIIISPYLYLFFSTKIAKSAFPPSQAFYSDLFHFLIPPPLLLISNVNLYQKMHLSWNGSNVYLGLPLIIIFFLFVREFWKNQEDPIYKPLIIFTFILFLASFGYWLHINGHTLIPMPWYIVNSLPLLKNALPTRFSLFISLAISIIISYWLTKSNYLIYLKSFLIFLAVLFLIPVFNPFKNPWAQKLESPAFINQKEYLKWLKPGDIIVALPYSQLGFGMYWQTQADLYFKMAGGYLGYMPPSFVNELIPMIFLRFSKQKNTMLAENQLVTNSLPHFIAQHNISAIIVNANRSTWKKLFSKIGLTPKSLKGVDFYYTKPKLNYFKEISQKTIPPAFKLWSQFIFISNQLILKSGGKSFVVIKLPKPNVIQLGGKLIVDSPQTINIFSNNQLIKTFFIKNVRLLQHFKIKLKAGKNIIEFISSNSKQENFVWKNVMVTFPSKINS